jgi:hypothetical protein
MEQEKFLIGHLDAALLLFLKLLKYMDIIVSARQP